MKKDALLWVILGAIILSLLLTGVGFGGYGGMMGMMYGLYGPGMMFFGWLYGILIFVALVLLTVWLWQQVQKA